MNLRCILRPDPTMVPVELRPLPKEPENEKKKSSSKTKGLIKQSKSKIESGMDKLNISYPTNFEHTVHVGFDPITGEFTVIIFYIPFEMYRCRILKLECCHNIPQCGKVHTIRDIMYSWCEFLFNMQFAGI